MSASFFSARTLFSLVLLVLLAFAPLSLQAAPLSAAERSRMLHQIERLMGEVVRLQALLRQREASELTSATTRIYRSRYFDVPLESVYRVVDGTLVRLDIPHGKVRPVDQQLFEFFKAVVGEKTVNRHVEEFRVFTGDIEALSAFVETKGDSDEWIIGVNRSEFEPGDRLNQQSFAELFVHEYAHLLFYDNESVLSDFENRFWSAADYHHAAAAGAARDRWDVMERYYTSNQQRFVSEYATISAEEDAAESFQVFVMSAAPLGTTLRDEKVRYFYSSPQFVQVRTELRRQLTALGVVL